ncbi:MAG: aminopeptidase [Anaerolineae bacterium]|nr:MAG: aminopeptidase [Anaerolineae bacterium]
MSDARIERFARILVDYSTHLGPGDRVLIEGTTAAEPLIRALYRRALEVGAHPHILMEFPEQQEIFFEKASESQLDEPPTFQKLAYEKFESRIRIHSATNPRALSGFDPAKLGRRQKALAPLLQTQMERGARGELRWLTTLFPTEGYAIEAGMGWNAYQDFVFRACHADEDAPVSYWKNVEAAQALMIERLHGHHLVTLRGPNVDLSLSIKNRTFINSCGTHNMPDGEIYTGPVEQSVNGWVKFTYPAIYNGVAVEGIELVFTDGRVDQAKAEKNQSFLLEMLGSDAGARYVGEFAIGTNFEIDRFTGNILFDEKIGGTFHMALGAGYPETGSKNKSVIHWDMICDMRQDAEMAVDGEVIYRNGQFVF